MQVIHDAALIKSIAKEIAGALRSGDWPWMQKNYPTFKMQVSERSRYSVVPASTEDTVLEALYTQIFGDRFEVLKHDTMDRTMFVLGRELTPIVTMDYHPSWNYDDNCEYVQAYRDMHEGIMFGGMRIVVSTLATELVPVRELSHKPWMRKTGYFKRVNKKWRERFGTKPREQVFMLGGHMLVMSKGTYDMLRNAIAENPALAYKELQRFASGVR